MMMKGGMKTMKLHLENETNVQETNQDGADEKLIAKVAHSNSLVIGMNHHRGFVCDYMGTFLAKYKKAATAGPCYQIFKFKIQLFIM